MADLVNGYLHGYGDWEQDRLLAQNEVLARFIYDKLEFGSSRIVLELGCGVAAQMIYLLKRYPDVFILGVDIDHQQLKRAKENLIKAGIAPDRYELILVGTEDYDWLKLLSDREVDTMFTVWVLEHLKDPAEMLRMIYRYAPAGMRLYATETFHHSLYLYPNSSALSRFWHQMMLIQSELGGDSNIGVRLGDLCFKAGYEVIWHEPYPLLFSKKNSEQLNTMLDYWYALLLASKEAMEIRGEWDEHLWSEIEDYFKLLRQEDQTIFYYSFVQILAQKR